MLTYFYNVQIFHYTFNYLSREEGDLLSGTDQNIR